MSVLQDNPRSPKNKKGTQTAAKGDVVKGKDLDHGDPNDEEEFESIGERRLTGKKYKGPGGVELEEIEGDVDPKELEGTAGPDPKTGKLKIEGKGWDEIRKKSKDGGRREEYFKRKPAVPIS